MGNAVPKMLDILDALRFFHRIPKVLRHVLQETATLDHVMRRILKQIEKRFFPGYETEHNVLSIRLPIKANGTYVARLFATLLDSLFKPRAMATTCANKPGKPT
jgi:hypothetical protein